MKFKAIFTVESGDVLEKRRPEGRQWYSQINGAKFVRYTVKEAPFEMTGLHGIIGKGVVLHDNPDDLGLSENNGNCVYPPKNTLAYHLHLHTIISLFNILQVCF